MRQTRNIVVPMAAASGIVRCPEFPVQPGQTVEVRGQVGNNAAGVRMWIGYPPAAITQGGYSTIASGAQGSPITVDVTNTADLWFASANSGDQVIVTVREG